MNTNKKYMVIQIGCIECGVSSYPIGIYDNLEEAEKVKEAHLSTWVSEGGDDYVEIWEVNTGENFVDILPIKEDNTAEFVEWKVVTEEGSLIYKRD